MFDAGGSIGINRRARVTLTVGLVQELDLLFQLDHSLQQMDDR
jgi:hypothetical protein